MKRNSSLVAITLAISLAMLPSAIAAEKTSLKTAGPSSATVVNTILSGSGTPFKTIGINGDFYIDTKNLNLYGPKTKGVWKLTTSLKPKEPAIAAIVTGDTGPAGPRGDTGAQGDKGDKGEKGVTGDKGVPGTLGIQGLTGNTGAVGATGFSGATGATGLTGATGAVGSTGTSGVAGAKGDSGTQGIQGLTGLAGAKGDTGTTGSTGSQGAKGDTGTAGAPGDAGISVVKFATVPLAALAITTAGNSTSQTFFTADSAGNYTFEVIVAGVANFSDTFKLNAEIVIGNSAITNQFAIASDAMSYANGISGRQYGFTVIGVAANVSAGAIFAIRITNQVAVSGGTSINFMGRALVNKVGSIG
jgi:hypothetical protein